MADFTVNFSLDDQTLVLHDTSVARAEEAADRAETAAATLTVDSALNSSSTNPVQNKVLNGEITNLKADLNTVSPAPSLTWTIGKNVDGSGNVSNNAYTALSNVFSVTAGDVLVRRVPNKDSNNKTLIFYVNQYAKDDSFISRTSVDNYGDTLTVGATTYSVRIAFGRTSGSSVQFASSDITNYFNIEVYRKAVTFDIGYVSRGTISSLGYTSIASCTESGIYTFGSSDSLSDLPDGWTGGGLVITRKTDGVIWQELKSLLYNFLRYGTTGKWWNLKQLIYAKYTSGAGENDSDAQLDIYIPRDTQNRRTMYQMGHCVKAPDNADAWRIMFMYRIDTSGTSRKLTMTGEWECAVKLDGRDDFSGGIVHGDEVDTSVTVFVDGTLTSISTLNTWCHELKIIRHSNLYDPNDHTTVIADHGVEYIYTVEGLTINQSVEWKVNATLSSCFLAMLPIIKVYSKYRYDDVSFDITENTSSNYSVSIPKAKSVTEYSTDYDCFTTMSVTEYPTGLTGGDCALVTDNNGLNYNKVYFPVCTGGSVQNGDVWKSTTIYRNR